MWEAGEERDSRRALNRAVLIGRCSDDSNVWTSTGFVDKDGREFDALGVKSACASRLCPHCIKQIQKRAQKRLVNARDQFWAENDPEFGKRERFITLTAPTLDGVSLYDSEKIFNRAFASLSHTDFWKARADAGAKHLEFTVNQRGYHSHIHLMLYGAYMERDAAQQEKTIEFRLRRAAKLAACKWRIVEDELPPLGNLQDEWTKCIKRIAKRRGHLLEFGANYSKKLQAYVLGSYCLVKSRKQIVPEVKAGWYSQWPLKDGAVVECHPTSAMKAGVDVRMVREKGRASVAEIGITSAVKELTKYITKSPTWEAVPDDHLVEMAEIMRWPRCFELLGAWRTTETPEEKQRKADAEEIGRLNAARKIVKIQPGEHWVDFTERLEREGGHPDSYIIAWDKLVAARAAQDEKEAEQRDFLFYASLDTDFISRSTGEVGGKSPPEKVPKVGRQKSLMTLGDELPFPEWFKVVCIRLTGVRRTRTGLLARQFPFNRFNCQDGTKFVGCALQSASREDMETRPRLVDEWEEFVNALSDEDRKSRRDAARERGRAAAGDEWQRFVYLGRDKAKGRRPFEKDRINLPVSENWNEKVRDMLWAKFSEVDALIRGHQ